MAMKYIKPETKTYKVELQQMIAESTTETLSDERQNPGGAASRGFGFFEEEDEE